jgi:hypothetical protein
MSKNIILISFLISIFKIVDLANIKTSFFISEYSAVWSQVYSTKPGYESSFNLTSTSGVSFYQCLKFCMDFGDCFSAIYTEHNSSFSLCSLYKSIIELNFDLVSNGNIAKSQKIAYVKGSYFLYLIFF